jgi:hypothetical protein
MLPAAPYVIEDEAKWNLVLDRYQIKQSTWKNMILDYQNWTPDFSPKVIHYLDDIAFLESTTFFHFERTTIKPMKKEFIKWLEEYWSNFFEDSFHGICSKILQRMEEFNRQYPDEARPYVNFIPLYGGRVREPTKFPGLEEELYNHQHEISYLLEPQVIKQSTGE